MIRIGIIGAGDIARVHAANLARIPDVRIACVHDVVPERAAAFAADYGASVCGGLGSAVDGVDAVYICTPPQYHREAAVRAIEAGKHVFCEKPLAATEADAYAIETAAAFTEPAFMVGFNFRFVPLFRQWHDLVATGDLGDVHSFWSVRVMWLPHLPPNWRTSPSLVVGMTIESLSHDFDYMRWLVGDAVSAYGRVATDRPDLDGYDNITSAILGLEFGGTASFHSSWASHAAHHCMGLIGSRGSAVCDGSAVRWRKIGDTEDRVLSCTGPEAEVNSHQAETEHFIQCIRSGEKPLARVRDGVATVKISHAVLRSAQAGIPVAVD